MRRSAIFAQVPPGSMQGSDSTPAATTGGAWPALAVLCAAQVVVVLSFQIAAIALPRIGDGLRLGPADLQWVISANALAFGGFLLLGGRAGDLFGHRRLFMAGLGLFALASLACGLAPSPPFLIAARVLQGIGTALFAPATVALIAEAFPEGQSRDRALGLWAAAGPVGGIVSVALGGALADALGWRAVFLISVPLAAIPLILAPALLPQQTDQLARRLDLPGTFVGTAAVGTLVYALDQTARHGLRSTPALLTLIAGGLLLAGFIVIERRSSQPLVPGPLLGRGGVVGASAVALFKGATTNTPIVFIALYVQQVRGASLFETGLAFLPCNLAIIVSSMLAARFAACAGFRWTMTAGMTAIVAGSAALGMLSVDAPYLTNLLPGIVLQGFGLGFVQLGIVGSITTGAEAADRGIAAGLMSTADQIGTAVGLAILTAVAAAITSRAPADATDPIVLVAGFQAAFRAVAVLAGLGVLATLLLPIGERLTSPEVRPREVVTPAPEGR